MKTTVLRIKVKRSLQEEKTLLKIGEKCVLCGTIENLCCLNPVSLFTISWLCEGTKLLNLLYLNCKIKVIVEYNSEACYDDD